MTLYLNAQILTQNTAQPTASAFVVEGNRFVFVGSAPDAHAVAARRSDAFATVDLGGRTVLPGFCDCHLHLVWFGTGLLRHADLLGTTDIDISKV